MSASNTYSVAIVYHSGYGHTKAQAEAVARGAAGVDGVNALLIPVEELTPEETTKSRWTELDGADAIIFGSPTYMGAVSAPYKAFIDATAAQWYEGRWANKLAAGFTNSGSQSGDKLNTLTQLAVLAAQHQMIWVSLGLMPGNNSNTGSADDINRIGSYLGAMAQSNVDAGPDVAPPDADKRTAQHLGTRVAEAVKRWGRAA
ncbi:MAG: flavodoxin family protein [Alphaproteobacteria bacterium]|nr:flavodoxin family protein [Alphaproteobacteria bacterium]